MCNGRTLKRWQAQSLQRLLALGRVKLALVIEQPEARPSVRKVRFSHLLFQLYSNLFAKFPALETVKPNETFLNAPRISCAAVKGGEFSEYFAEEDIEGIRGYDLDFIVKFGCGILRGRILNVPRYGIWSFHHGDGAKYRGRPACFWEIYHGEPVTGAVLQRITERLDAGIVLRKGYFRTQNSSYARTVQLVFSESARWPSQVCIDILNNHAEYLWAGPSGSKARIFTLPHNRETVLFVIRLLGNRLKGLYRLFFRYSFWNIGVVIAPIESFLDPDYKPVINWLSPPKKGEFRADPFGKAAPPYIHVLFENLDYHHPKGIIYTARISESSFITQPREIIELPVHMSYPFLVEEQGQIYCIPETNRAREVSLYRALAFPNEWTKTATLLTNVMAIDTTVLQFENSWWLMFTDRERGGDANLYVWHAPTLMGPWRPHANNPVKSDVRSSRPGGTPFLHNGMLYRPTQDCSKTGGGRVVINWVRRLTPTEFEEESVASIEPDRRGPYPEGLHTLSKVDDFTLVDGKKFEFSAVGLINNVAKGIRRTLDLDV